MINIVFFLSLISPTVAPFQNSNEASPLRCGANSLYLNLKFLRIGNVESIFEKLESRSSDIGCSLLDLKEAAAELGCTSHVVKKNSPGEIDVPHIAHLLLNQSMENHNGHFVVILNENENYVKYIDGTTAKINKVTRDWFDKRATGYCLIFEKTNRMRKLLCWGGTFGFLSLAFRLILKRKKIL